MFEKKRIVAVQVYRYVARNMSSFRSGISGLKTFLEDGIIVIVVLAVIRRGSHHQG